MHIVNYFLLVSAIAYVVASSESHKTNADGSSKISCELCSLNDEDYPSRFNDEENQMLLEKRFDMGEVDVSIESRKIEFAKKMDSIIASTSLWQCCWRGANWICKKLMGKEGDSNESLESEKEYLKMMLSDLSEIYKVELPAGYFVAEDSAIVQPLDEAEENRDGQESCADNAVDTSLAKKGSSHLAEEIASLKRLLIEEWNKITMEEECKVEFDIYDVEEILGSIFPRVNEMQII